VRARAEGRHIERFSTPQVPHHAFCSPPFARGEQFSMPTGIFTPTVSIQHASKHERESVRARAEGRHIERFSTPQVPHHAFCSPPFARGEQFSMPTGISSWVRAAQLRKAREPSCGLDPRGMRSSLSRCSASCPRCVSGLKSCTPGARD
jgi:hypothetical protein